MNHHILLKYKKRIFIISVFYFSLIQYNRTIPHKKVGYKRMKKLVMDEGLLITDMELTHKGKVIQLKRVLIDTGSASTLVSSDLAQKIDLVPEMEDSIYRIYGVGGFEYVYSKKVDGIRIGSMEVLDFHIEIGSMDYGIELDGIIGLNLLQKLNATINTRHLFLQSII